MDNLLDFTDPVVAGSGDFHNAGGIYPYTACHRHRCGVDQNYSGPTAHLSLWLSISLKSVTDEIRVVVIPCIGEQISHLTHFLAHFIFPT